MYSKDSYKEVLVKSIRDVYIILSNIIIIMINHLVLSPVRQLDPKEKPDVANLNLYL